MGTKFISLQNSTPMKDQGIPNQTQSTTQKKSRNGRKDVNRHPKQSDLHDNPNFKNKNEELRKMPLVVHFQQNLHFF